MNARTHARSRGGLIAIVAIAAIALPQGALGVAPWSTGAQPHGIALDGAGNVFTVNSSDDTATKITPDGTPVDPAGSPSLAWATTGFTSFAIATDRAGNVYLPGSLVGTIAKYTPDGAAVTGPGMPAGVWARCGLGAQSIALDGAGNVYTVNSADETISKIAPDGTALTGPGMADGVWAALPGAGAWRITADPAGTLHVADTSGDITKIGPDGRVAWTVQAMPGLWVLAVVTDSAGNAYATGWDFGPEPGAVSKVTPDGKVLTGAGMPDGIWAWTEGNAFSMTIDSAEHVFFATNNPFAVWAVPAAGGTSEQLAAVGAGPWGITIDAAGNLYTADGYDDHVSKVVPGVDTPSAGDVAPAPPDVPAPPTAVAGDGTARVAVPANPADARHGVPSSYIVEAVGDASRRCTVTAPATACTVEGLVNGTPYAFTARARLNAWTTAPSAASAAVTPAARAAEPSAATAGTGARVAAGRLIVGPRGGVVVPVACPADAPGPCQVTGTLSAAVPAAGGTAHEAATRTRTLGTFRLAAVAPGRTARASLRLAPSVMRAYRLAGTRRLGATVTSTTTVGAAVSPGQRQRVVLLFARPGGVPVVG